MPRHNLIKGDEFRDERGVLRFVNDFDMDEVARFYEITPKNQQIIRAWQGHQIEKKWFYCLSGSFVINVIQIDDFDNPSDELLSTRVELEARTPEILAIPGGYATGIKATSENARLQVFSNFGLKQSGEDDYRFSLEKWTVEW